jgi:hypothetical protein
VACGAIAAALGQKLSDMEGARAGQHGVGRAAALQRGDAWNVGRQEVARKMLRRRAAARCSTGRWRATWRGQGWPARGREAAGQRPGWHVHRRRGVLEQQGRRTWPGQSSGGARQRNREEGERGRRRRIQMQYLRNAGTLL